MGVLTTTELAAEKREPCRHN